MEDPLASTPAAPPATDSAADLLLDSTTLTPERVDDITPLVDQVNGLALQTDDSAASTTTTTATTAISEDPLASLRSTSPRNGAASSVAATLPSPLITSPLSPTATASSPLSVSTPSTTSPTVSSLPSPFSSSSRSSTASSTSSYSSSASTPYNSGPPPPLPADASFSARLTHFHHCLNLEKIPRKTIQQFVFEYGVPDQKGMRSLLWKLLLNYMPWTHSEWEDSLKKSRADYARLVEELSTNPYKKMAQSGGGKVVDDPLAPQSAEWSEYYKDEAIRHEIDKDVKRTYSSFHFFQERVKPIITTLEEARTRAKAEQAHVPSLFDNVPSTSSSVSIPPSAADVTRAPPAKEDETHQDVIRRILFVYAKLNPGVRYVQGMNEILAPMYYVFAHDTNPLFQHHAEPDAFFCFTAVMSDIRDRFIKSLDSSPSGVLAVVKLINSYLQQLDPVLWAHLEAEKVNPQFYSFRWITLLLSQEFELPEVLRLWDSLFADPNRFEFLLYCCCSMLVCVRERLLDGDFADAMRMLQRYQENNIPFLTILSTAVRLRRDMESKKRGEQPTNPVVPQPLQPGGSRPTSPVGSGGAGAGAQTQFNAMADAASTTAGQLFKSVSSFFSKK